MTKYSECVLLLNNIKGLLLLYKAGELHQTLCDMLENIPTASDPPPAPQLMLHMPSVDTASKKTKKAKGLASPVDIYRVVKHEFHHKNPELGACVIPQVPNIAGEMTLENLEPKLNKCQEMMREVDDMTLYNAANFGHLLELAFTTFQEEKESLKSMWPTFKFWVEDRCQITDTWAKELRNFYNLVHEYPQLLFCRLPLSFFRKNRKHILTYFSCEHEIALQWKHPVTCQCNCCGPLRN